MKNLDAVNKILDIMAQSYETLAEKYRTVKKRIDDKEHTFTDIEMLVFAYRHIIEPDSLNEEDRKKIDSEILHLKKTAKTESEEY